jgi:rod shape determining protein RodA
MSASHRLRHFAWGTFVPALALAVIGVLLVQFSDFGVRRRTGWSPGAKQVLSLGISLAAFAVALVPSYLRLQRLAVPLYSSLLLVTLYATYFGVERNNARRWIALGFYDLTPSELMKIGAVLVLARLLMYRRNVRDFRSLLLPFGVALLPAAVVAKQPDLSTALLFVPLPFALLFAAGARLKHLALCAGLFLALGGATVLVGVEAGLLEPYQLERITAFSNLGDDSASHQNYQISNGLAALGAGGFDGYGSAEKTRSIIAFVPERHSDFIFAVAGARLGFLGGALILGLYAALVVGLLGVASRTREPFGRLLVVGSTTLLVTQAVANLGMTTGLLPVTGLPLPLLSSGGSSLLSTFLSLGLALNVSMRRVRVVAKEDFN